MLSSETAIESRVCHQLANACKITNHFRFPKLMRAFYKMMGRGEAWNRLVAPQLLPWLCPLKIRGIGAHEIAFDG